MPDFLPAPVAPQEVASLGTAWVFAYNNMAHSMRAGTQKDKGQVRDWVIMASKGARIMNHDWDKMSEIDKKRDAILLSSLTSSLDMSNVEFGRLVLRMKSADFPLSKAFALIHSSGAHELREVLDASIASHQLAAVKYRRTTVAMDM
jgi:hypothetical protein